MSAVLAFLLGPNGVFVWLIAAIAAAYAYGRKGGKDRQLAKDADARLKSRSEADKIDDAIAGRDAETNRKELGRWSPWGKH